MNKQASIAFVNGVDRYSAKPPKGLSHRFAVLTWFEHNGEMADPWSLFREAIPRIGSLVNAKGIMAEFYCNQTKGILFRRTKEILVAQVAWEGLVHSSDEALQHQTFPCRIRFQSKEQTEVIAITELWCALGGPSPYHDSVTVSFFSADSLSDQIHKVFCDAATKLGIRIGEITEASQAKNSISH